MLIERSVKKYQKGQAKRPKGTSFPLSNEEFQMLQTLKNKHKVNLSATFRNFLVQLHNEYENKNPKTKDNA